MDASRVYVDGSKRPRRNGQRGEARRTYYARARSARFAARFGFTTKSRYDLD